MAGIFQRKNKVAKQQIYKILYIRDSVLFDYFHRGSGCQFVYICKFLGYEEVRFFNFSFLCGCRCHRLRIWCGLHVYDEKCRWGIHSHT